MGVYLYCIVPPDVGPPRTLRGLDSAPVRLHAAGRIGSWISFLETPPTASVPNVQRHNEVVEAALASGATPLPVRFGQWLADEAALDAALRERAAAHAAALQVLAHTVEYGVRVLDPGCQDTPQAAVATGSSGTAYMRALASHAAAERQVEARGREIAVRMRAVLGSLVRQERVEALPSRHGLVSIAHLMERDCDAQYHTAVDVLRREYPGLRFLLTGPWPPYSFTP